jgi:hypothetical protein
VAGLLTFVRDEIVHLDPGSYMWVSIKRFSMCGADATEQQALTALLDQHEYHDHYAGQPISEQDHHSLHGPYVLTAITPDLFRRITAEGGRATLLYWVDDPEPASGDTHLRLADHVFRSWTEASWTSFRPWARQRSTTGRGSSA